ncbi:MAG: ATP-binding protein [Planctomycetia bacterium]
MAWQGIEGHDAVVAGFVAAEERGRIAGSYLFVGPPGVGKGTFARRLAGSLLCAKPGPGLVACGSCVSCIQAAAGSHPDIDVVGKPEDRATIPLESLIGEGEHRMREGLVWRLLLRPALGSRKVAIVLDADHLSEEAANCLLKTLEEPPAGAVIILVGTGVERQLPTIRSRCQIVRFRPLPDSAVERILAAEAAREGGVVEPEAVRRRAVAAAGSLARGRALADPVLAEFRGRLLELLGRRPLPGVELARDTLAVVEAAGKDAPPRRARLRLVLETVVDILQAAVREAATGQRPADAAWSRVTGAWAADADAAAAALGHTLDALDGVERNANLTILVDAWTAILEEPRLAGTA